MGALKRATKREREVGAKLQTQKLGAKEKTLTLNSQALCDKNKERSGLKAPKRGREVGALKRATKRERERERSGSKAPNPKTWGKRKKHSLSTLKRFVTKTKREVG